MYLLHGVLGNHTDWLTGTGIMRWAEERDLAVVMPSGENAFYVDHPWDDDMYGKFIGEELIQFTRKTFPLSHKREDTYIGGLSMGGYGALINGLKYNHIFSHVISLSGAFRVNERILEPVENPMFFIDTKEYLHKCFGDDLESAIKKDINPEVRIQDMIKDNEPFPRIYMACGDKDDLLIENQLLSDFMTEKGVKHDFTIVPGYGHEWDLWHDQIKEALDWLPLEGKNAGQNSGNVGI